MMNSQQAALWQRIQAFELDMPDARLSFSRRLARENAWPMDKAKAAIAEYKKFVFLAMVLGHPVTPSDQVDQVWHLHLTYSDSYWNELCDQVLGAPLHHNPTLGSAQESNKFTDWYSRTLDQYEVFFGAPPTELWPPPDIRFGRDLEFQRVNLAQNWVIPKPDLRQSNVLQACNRISRAISQRSALSLLLLSLCALMTVGLLAPPTAWAQASNVGSGSVQSLSLMTAALALIAINLSLHLVLGLAELLKSMLSAFSPSRRSRRLIALVNQLRAVLWVGGLPIIVLAIAAVTAIQFCMAIPAATGPEFLAIYGALTLVLPLGMLVNGKICQHHANASVPVNASSADSDAWASAKMRQASFGLCSLSCVVMLILCGSGGVRLIVGLLRGKPIGFLCVMVLISGLLSMWMHSYWYKCLTSIRALSHREAWQHRMDRIATSTVALMGLVLLGLPFSFLPFPLSLIVMFLLLAFIVMAVSSPHSSGSYSGGSYSGGEFGGGGGSCGDGGGDGGGGDGGGCGGGGCGGCGG